MTGRQGRTYGNKARSSAVGMPARVRAAVFPLPVWARAPSCWQMMLERHVGQPYMVSITGYIYSSARLITLLVIGFIIDMHTSV